MRKSTNRIVILYCLLLFLVIAAPGCSVTLSERQTKTYYYASGAEQYRFDMLNGQRTGRFVRWYEDGTKESECTAQDSAAQRKCFIWFADGTLFRETDYSPDGSTGLEQEWFSNGNPRSEGAVKNKIREGLWQYWSRDGSVQWDVLYRDGKIADVYPEVTACPKDNEIERTIRKRNRHFLSSLWCKWKPAATSEAQPVSGIAE